MDNIDINEETSSDIGTYVTQVAAFRQKIDGEPAIDIQGALKSERLKGHIYSLKSLKVSL